MKVLVKQLLPVIVLFFLFSCDPMRTIRIITPEGSGTSISIYGNNGFFSHSGDREKDGFALQASSTDPKLPKDTTLFLGFGSWPSRKFMSRDAQLIDSIVLQGKRGTLVLREADQVTSFLVKSRRGILKNRMLIRIR